jgi:PHD/YefM family antitoxin component YafN of YafNO toxin-antitoxin module
MTSKRPALHSLSKLPRTPASDIKKLGWRGMMNSLRSNGKFLVTNHDQAEAVILPIAEFDALMQIKEQAEAQTEAALAGLRNSFDERLSVLQGQTVADSLRSTVRGKAKLQGKVKAGSGY